MIARDHALLRQLGAGNFSDDVPDAAIAVILFQVHLDARRAWTYVISERQSALPGARRIRPSQILQDGLGIGVGNRHRRNFGKRRRAFRRGAFRIRQIGRGSYARRGGVAGKHENVIDGAALHAAIGTPGAVGVFIALEVAVIHGVGINQHPGGAVLLRHKTFYAAIILAIAHQHDLAAHVYL